jgi:hypothetical protein
MTLRPALAATMSGVTPSAFRASTATPFANRDSTVA